jgi:hypothetical protein
VSIVQVLCSPDLLWGTPPLLDELMRCKGNHDVYACSGGGVAMLGDDGMDTSSRVSVARCTWEPVVVSCLVWR